MIPLKSGVYQIVGASSEEYSCNLCALSDEGQGSPARKQHVVLRPWQMRFYRVYWRVSSSHGDDFSGASITVQAEQSKSREAEALQKVIFLLKTFQHEVP